MVDHVEHGQVTELLPQQKEQGVKVVNKLGEEIPPAKAEDPHGVLVVRVIDRLTVPAVVSSNKEGPALSKHPEAEESLAEVVDDHDPFDVVGLSILHELGTGNLWLHWAPVSDNTETHLHDVDVEDADDGGGPDGGHQEPVINSRVS